MHDNLIIQNTDVVAHLQDNPGYLDARKTQVYLTDHRIYNIVGNRFQLAHDLRELIPESDQFVKFNPTFVLNHLNGYSGIESRIYNLSGEAPDSVATFIGRSSSRLASFVGDTLILAGGKGIQHYLIEGGYNDIPTTNPISSVIPLDYSLETPYPNPFSEMVEIPFSLPLRSEVKLSIYNLLGQEITVLVNKPMRAGSHTVIWNSKNEDMTGVASGIYFVKLEALDFVKTRKIVFLR